MKKNAPAAVRNREPIAEVLAEVLPSVPGRAVLEIASGTGQHAVFFGERFDRLTWQPTDPDPSARASIDAYRHDSGLANLRPALDLDVTRRPWPVTSADVVLCCNMIHIAPWEATEALFGGAAEVLSPAGLLVTYGPYFVDDEPTAPSNLDFDASLRARNPAWGIRRLEAVQEVARAAGMSMERRFSMPANNLMLVFRRDARRRSRDKSAHGG